MGWGCNWYYWIRRDKIGKAVTQSFRGAGRVISAPMRVLSAGDEFLKSMMFKARMTSLINSKILQENPEFDNKFYKFSKDRK